MSGTPFSMKFDNPFNYPSVLSSTSLSYNGETPSSHCLMKSDHSIARDDNWSTNYLCSIDEEYISFGTNILYGKYFVLVLLDKVTLML